MVLRREFYVMP